MSKQDKLELCAKCRKPDLCERRGECMDRAAAAPAQWSDVASDGGLDPRNAPPVAEPVLTLPDKPFGYVVEYPYGVTEFVKVCPYLDTAIGSHNVYTAEQLRAAIAADRAARVPLTDEQIDAAIQEKRDDLLDHIYEHGTSAEGVQARLRSIARAVLAATQGSKP